MTDAHHDDHEDHGHTFAAWFLTVSWCVVWTIAGTIIILGESGALAWTDGDVVLWTSLGLGVSVVLAVVAGGLKAAGLGRKTLRPTPPTREEWLAARSAAEPAPAPAGPAAAPAPAVAAAE
ncbi:hypothetical protein CLV63_13441 [Murinocardiopsis flavida]|uniref:Uncharacterized protein n=1 Tax=Murinocardiopsis flavida TaxID=645275 RepID=A0A2P8CNN3_9ACTN|nr:hypothetical protein [Murinocardiopsis flavida]PSK86554.1 hypothetical protein CLV63_13441 [Murinocardiopsis flavida]